ncbi:MAG TPA: hypothetical protein VKT72_11090 [Candidatus Baltobacteraceae bacterium]|nr:hypothetical protein [Candidatus Baltobacteraceae bacterium]
MLELFRILLLGATAGAVFAAVLGSLPIRQGSRLALGAGIGTWIALALALTASGATRNAPFVVPAMFMLPLVAAGLAATSTASRSAMTAIPMPLIIALNAMRVLGVLMLIAGVTGVMSGPFPYAAGIGDMITGLFALPVARIAAKNPRDVRVLEWNIFGALDLIVAVSLGVTFARTGSAAMTTLPWALIPLVLVPMYLIGHALVFAHMRATAVAGRSSQTRLAQA